MLLTVVVSVCVSELILRLAFPQEPSWLDIYRRHPVLPFFSVQPNVEASQHTGATNWTVITDSNGFRVGPHNLSHKKRLAIVLGDSYTFGVGVNYEESFVGLLNTSGAGYHFLNSGVPGYGPTQYRMTLEYLLNEGYRPEIILLAIYVGNDFYDCVWNKDISVKDGIIGAKGGIKEYLKRNLHTYRLLSKVYHLLSPVSFGGFRGLMENLYDPNSWKRSPLRRAREIFRSELTSISEITRKLEIPMIAVLIPTRYAVEGINRESTIPDYEQLDRLPEIEAASVLESLRIPFTDVTYDLAAFGVDQTYYRHDGHLTPQGNDVVCRQFLYLLESCCPQ